MTFTLKSFAMPQLSKKHLLEHAPADARLFSLPEKVLQFGTGVLLRGLPDYLIDRANRQGVFNGRIVAVKSTGASDPAAFEQQDGLYTLCVRGIEEGLTVAENTVCTAISRVLSAKNQWDEVLAFATSPALKIVISNTTEVGIQLLKEDCFKSPPASFPGKLLSVLDMRYAIYRNDPTKGLVIVPTELVPENGSKLKAIVLELARYNDLEPGFFDWLEKSCIFCNSLVDRIVPGRPAPEQAAQLQTALGYTDDLLTMAEAYHLWAIEGDERAKSALSFHLTNPAVIIEPDIEIYRELKLRLLNGTHTLACGLAHLAGFATVGEAMRDVAMSGFVEKLMLFEIAPAIPCQLPNGAAERFGQQVLDRFRNPFVEHRWLNITLQYASKMKMRVVPVLLEHYRQGKPAPQHLALGFAAFLAFYRQPDYPVQDDHAAYFFEKWKNHAPSELPRNVLSDSDFWGENLAEMPGFAEQVTASLVKILEDGAGAVLMDFLKK